MNGGVELQLLGSYVGFLLALGLLVLVLAPLFIWRSSARTNALLARLIDEQERTADLLALLVRQQERQAAADDQPVARPRPDKTNFTLEAE